MQKKRRKAHVGTVVTSVPSRSSQISPRQRRRVVSTTLHIVTSHKITNASRHIITTRTRIPLNSVACCFSSVRSLLRRTFSRFTQTSMLGFTTHVRPTSAISRTYSTVTLDVRQSVLNGRHSLGVGLRFCALTTHSLSFHSVDSH